MRWLRSGFFRSDFLRLRFVIFCCRLMFCCDASFRLKRKGAGAGRKQSKKAAKDPNKPKRPPSAFFVFMYGFRFFI